MPSIFNFPRLTKIFITLILLSACAKQGTDKQKDIIAYVNKEPIYGSELKREIAHKGRNDPAFKLNCEAQCDYLNNVIDRKLIVQAAMKKGLAEEERFVNTIKSFWEQTLIRDFIDYKKTQAQDYVYVSEEDINKYYNNLSKKVTFRVLRAASKHEADTLYKKYLKDKDTQNWQTLGPLAYEDISSSVLLEAFELPEAQVKELSDGINYYLIEVVSREDIAIEPLEALKPEIEKRAAALKERSLFDEWLKEERKKADIKINKDYLQH